MPRWRMSGASGKVPAAIHVSPEALAGGALLGVVTEILAVRPVLKSLDQHLYVLSTLALALAAALPTAQAFAQATLEEPPATAPAAPLLTLDQALARAARATGDRTYAKGASSVYRSLVSDATSVRVGTALFEDA